MRSRPAYCGVSYQGLLIHLFNHMHCPAVGSTCLARFSKVSNFMNPQEFALDSRAPERVNLATYIVPFDKYQLAKLQVAPSAMVGIRWYTGMTGPPQEAANGSHQV